MAKKTAQQKEMERMQRKNLGLKTGRGPKPSTPTRAELAAVLGMWMLADERRANELIDMKTAVKRLIVVTGAIGVMVLWGAI
jgi:hypothetical protein